MRFGHHSGSRPPALPGRGKRIACRGKLRARRTGDEGRTYHPKVSFSQPPRGPPSPAPRPNRLWEPRQLYHVCGKNRQNLHICHALVHASLSTGGLCKFRASWAEFALPYLQRYQICHGDTGHWVCLFGTDVRPIELGTHLS